MPVGFNFLLLCLIVIVVCFVSTFSPLPFLLTFLFPLTFFLEMKTSAVGTRAAVCRPGTDVPATSPVALLWAGAVATVGAAAQERSSSGSSAL